jgi:hypothetical protein
MILYALCLLALVSCEAEQPAQSSGETPTARASSSPAGASSRVSGVFFAERRPGGEYMLSEIRGELVLDERGCLRVRHQGYSPVIVWPSGFEAERSDGGVQILDREGKVVAKVGEVVYMGGGGTPIRGNKAVYERTRRELLERCPASYWVAAPPVQMPRP